MKYPTLFLIGLIIALFVASFLAPGWGGLLAGIVVFLSLTAAFFSIVQQQFVLHRNGYISKIVMARNILLELTGILLAMLSAGLIGRFAAEVFTRQISNEVAKLIAGIVIGLSIGVVVGIIFRRAWGRLVGIVS